MPACCLPSQAGVDMPRGHGILGRILDPRMASIYTHRASRNRVRSAMRSARPEGQVSGRTRVSLKLDHVRNFLNFRIFAVFLLFRHTWGMHACMYVNVIGLGLGLG